MKAKKWRPREHYFVEFALNRCARASSAWKVFWYTEITKEDIRRNRDNVGERLGFLGRIIHSMNPRAWLKEMRLRLGENVDFASAVVQ
jgi:hypothetical protein